MNKNRHEQSCDILSGRRTECAVSIDISGSGEKDLEVVCKIQECLKYAPGVSCMLGGPWMPHPFRTHRSFHEPKRTNNNAKRTNKLKGGPRTCRRASKYFRYAPGVSCMLGPLDAAPKQKKPAAQRIARKPVGAVVAPQLLEEEDADAKVCPPHRPSPCVPSHTLPTACGH